jgi:sn-glycerol 3-phosphate transport system ATP-binding protein
VAEVEYRSITKRFPNDVVALTEFDLRVDDGEFVILVGPSGCGKSTALRLLAGLDRPSSGEIWVGGSEVTTHSPGERDIAMVFQNYALYPHMSVYRNLAYGLRQRRTPKAEIDRRVHEMGEILGISELLDRKPAQLSGGQRQRVAMGRALVREPQAFLLDEPLSNLDAKLRGQVRAELKRIHQRLAITSIYVTHDQVEAMTLADRICVMNQGEVQQLGSPQEVYEHPANVFVAGFMGSPAMNLVPATVEAGKVVLGGHALRPAPTGHPDVVVGIRPECLRIASEGEPGIQVTVDFHEPLGSHALVHCVVGHASVGVIEDSSAGIVVQAGSSISPRPGERLTVTADPKDIYLFDVASGTALAEDQRERIGPVKAGTSG